MFSLVGAWIQEVFHLSMPGSLIGMLILVSASFYSHFAIKMV